MSIGNTSSKQSQYRDIYDETRLMF